MWKIYCKGDVCASLPTEKLARIAFSHYLRARPAQSYEFSLKDPDGKLIASTTSGIAKAGVRGKK